MIIGILKETAPLENRVAASVETVKKLIELGASLHIETQAGLAASFTDQAYTDAGAQIKDSAKEILNQADIILTVQCLNEAQIKLCKKNALIIGFMELHKNTGLIKQLEAASLSAIAMERIPRITRAQTMDALSSQSNLAGYKAVIEAANLYGKAFPMMMTAAGTIAPAKVFVMGAGVAGLQAIATAKRLGAIVSATDVRPASKEQVESLGGKFVMVESDELKQAETAGGYAKEMSAEFKKAQAELIAKTIPAQDIIITTALIPGRPAPVLVTEEMVKSMKPGSVIVDLATSQGGNCSLSVADQVVVKHGVHLIGHSNMPSRLASDASQLYAKNLFHLLKLILAEGKLVLNEADEIINAALIVHQGQSRGGK